MLQKSAFATAPSLRLGTADSRIPPVSACFYIIRLIFAIMSLYKSQDLSHRELVS
jgi:hypothetical protein